MFDYMFSRTVTSGKFVAKMVHANCQLLLLSDGHLSLPMSFQSYDKISILSVLFSQAKIINIIFLIHCVLAPRMHVRHRTPLCIGVARVTQATKIFTQEKVLC